MRASTPDDWRDELVVIGPRLCFTATELPMHQNRCLYCWVARYPTPFARRTISKPGNTNSNFLASNNSLSRDALILEEALGASWGLCS